jgi:hypothetical protein
MILTFCIALKRRENLAAVVAFAFAQSLPTDFFYDYRQSFMGRIFCIRALSTNIAFAPNFRLRPRIAIELDVTPRQRTKTKKNTDLWEENCPGRSQSPNPRDLSRPTETLIGPSTTSFTRRKSERLPCTGVVSVTSKGYQELP